MATSNISSYGICGGLYDHNSVQIQKDPVPLHNGVFFRNNITAVRALEM